MKKPARFLTNLILSFALLSCSSGKVDPIDTQAGLSLSDYRKNLLKNSEEERLQKARNAQDEAPVPNISKLIVTPPPPDIGGNKTIAFSVTDQVPLKDVLIELGRIAKIDVDVDPTITGGIILNAKNRPLKEVVDRIATLGNLRYTYKNGVLYFENDSPYVKNYFVDYLNGNQLWTDVDTNIKAILAASDSNKSSDETSSSSSGSSSVTLNKSAGIISVFATDKQHKAVEKYLADVEKTSSAQVLIEAKFIEVTLSHQFNTGINWDWGNNRSSLVLSNGYSAPTGEATGNTIGYTLRKLFNQDLNASVSALEQFGTVRALSSPRVHAINNQKAVLNFSTKKVFFKVDSSQSTTASTSSVVTSTITSTKQEVDVGIQLDITPSINYKTNEITLNIKPTLSSANETVNDPASPRDSSGDVIADLINKVPIVQSKTLDTIAKIQSGNIIVIGGLLENSSTNTDRGVPFIARIPIIGWLFKSISKESSTKETVIFIKATVVNSGTPASKYDRDIQNKFDPNKRPFFNNN